MSIKSRIKVEENLFYQKLGYFQLTFTFIALNFKQNQSIR